jgi:hypothetical protein
MLVDDIFLLLWIFLFVIDICVITSSEFSFKFQKKKNRLIYDDSTIRHTLLIYDNINGPS